MIFKWFLLTASNRYDVTKQQLISDNKQLISDLAAANETIKSLQEVILSHQATIDALQRDIADVRNQNNLLIEHILCDRKKLYGRSSEQTLDSKQMLLLDITDVQPDEAPPAKTVNIKAHTRTASAKTTLEEAMRKLPIGETIEHTLAEEERICPECGKVMSSIGTTERNFLRLLPAVANVVKHITHAYGCTCCKHNNEKQHIVRAAEAIPLYPKCLATAETAAQIMVQKAMMGTPLYRQEQEWNHKGLPLSRQTMSNWVIKCSELYLEPIYNVLHEQLCQRTVLHADETTLQVLKDGKSAQSKNYMWLFRTSGDAKHHIILYNYDVSRSASVPKKFLQKFSGYLHVDGYSAYHKLPDTIILVGCWAHARRKFFEAVQAVPKAVRHETLALKGKEYIDKIFRTDALLSDMDYQERKRSRTDKLKPLIDDFYDWVTAQDCSSKNKFSAAISYAQNQRKHLENIFLDGRLELSNNRAERSIKPFVIGRKNFLFSVTARGAKASAVVYSLVETAKANGLDPYMYLKGVLEVAPQVSQSTENWPEKLLPFKATDTSTK